MKLSLMTMKGWVTYTPLKNTPDYGPIVTDIERHLPAKHSYRDADKITWAHEGTHGINSQLRSKYSQPGFYLLSNDAFTLAEPSTTIAAVAKKIPQSLRGRIYKLYCQDQQRYWNTQPTYLIDEWTAYFNGSLTRKAHKITGRAETVWHLMEMAVYATCVPYSIKCSDCSGCEDAELKELLRYMWEVTLRLVGSAHPTTQTLQTNTDCIDLYKWLKDYFGAPWVATQFEDKPDYNIWD